MPENILILGAGPYYKNCIASAKHTGYRVICIDRDPNALGQSAADAFFPVDFSNKQAVLEFAKEHQVRAIVPLNDYGVQTAAFVSKMLGLNGISEQAALRVTDKYEMRQCWEQAGLPNPAFRLVASADEARGFAEEYGFPIIFKPANSLGGGSRGVQTAHTHTEIETAFTFAQSVYADARVLVEECVSGVEHSAEVIVIDGEPHVITAADKVKTPYPYRVDEQVIYPTRISVDQRQALDQVIRDAVKAVGITTGAAHIELCTTEKGPILFEMGARCGGGATADPITSCVTGYPYFQNVVRILAGECVEPPNATQAQKPCIYGFFTVENQSQFGPIENNPTLQKQFLDWDIFPRDTQPILTRQGSDRLGYYIYQGTPESLESRLTQNLSLPVTSASR